MDWPSSRSRTGSPAPGASPDRRVVTDDAAASQGGPLRAELRNEGEAHRVLVVPVRHGPPRRRANRPLGSRLAVPAAEDDLANDRTDTIREVVRGELAAFAGHWQGHDLFVLLHPAANEACYHAATAYQRHLRDSRTFRRLSLGEAVAVLTLTGAATWVDELAGRYLDYGRLEHA